MPRFLFDIDHLTLYHNGHAAVRQRFGAEPPRSVGLSPITHEEALRGRLARVARHGSGPQGVRTYTLLVETVLLLNEFPCVAYDAASDQQFQQLLALRLRVGTHDLKIAAAALVNS